MFFRVQLNNSFYYTIYCTFEVTGMLWDTTFLLSPLNRANCKKNCNWAVDFFVIVTDMIIQNSYEET